jgi:cobalt-precorrin 5A hydrolase
LIAAGIGCRGGCSAADVLTALERALAAAKRSADEVHALFAPDSKRDEPGLSAAAARLGKPLRLLSRDQLQQHGSAVLTKSEHALRHYGVGSVAEAAALAGASLATSARLLCPRAVAGEATCALAVALR